MKTFEVHPRSNGWNHRYCGVAIFVDSSKEAAAKTPNPFNPNKRPFEMLQFKTGECLTGRDFKLDWTINGHDQFAQVQFLEIDYHYPECEFKKCDFF